MKAPLGSFHQALEAADGTPFRLRRAPKAWSGSAGTNAKARVASDTIQYYSIRFLVIAIVEDARYAIA